MQQIRFPARGGFHATVKQRVEQYFAASGRSTTGDWRLFVKTGVILTWLVGSYALLVFGSTSLLVTILTVFALAQGCALVGFNIMHGGAHESYARSKIINRLMGGMLNVLGGSQMLCGALSLFEDDGEKAQRRAILPRHSTSTRAHCHLTETTMRHDAEGNTCYPP